MLDIQHELADGSQKEGLLHLKDSLPLGSVWDEFDNTSSQANFHSPPVVFTLYIFGLRRLLRRMRASRLTVGQ